MNELQLFPDPVQPDRGILELGPLDMVVRRRRKPAQRFSRAAQARLFGTTRQKRNHADEKEAVYEAVLALRKKGHRVYRMGNTKHTVDGMQVTVGELKKMARAE